MSERLFLKRRIGAMIDDFAAGRQIDLADRDALIEDLAAWQATRIAEYGRLRRRGSWPPALPTDVFRFRRIAAHTPSQDVRVFRSSGTTSADRSIHAYRDLSLYDMASRAAARHMLFPDAERMRLVLLAATEEEAPDSSLGYMLARFAQWFGSRAVWVWRRGTLDLERLTEELRDAEASGEPIALLGTSFAFVHAEDGLAERRFALPPGSRLLQTGGYKGRSREVDPQELLDVLVQRFAIPSAFIINEFGATELSSQLYETTLRAQIEGKPGSRRLWAPPWVRATPVDPDTLEPVRGDAVGILRIDDCANLDSVCCIQTADLARCLDDGIVVLGRAAGATARGCSLAVDLALGAADE